MRTLNALIAIFFACTCVGCADEVIYDIDWLMVNGTEIRMNLEDVDLDPATRVYSKGYGYGGNIDWEDEYHGIGTDGVYGYANYEANEAGIWRVNWQQEGNGPWADIARFCDSADVHEFCHQNADESWALCFHSDGEELYFASHEQCEATE